MRNLNRLMVPKIPIKEDPLGFINIHCVAKNQEIEGDPTCAIKKKTRGLVCFRRSGRRFRFGQTLTNPVCFGKMYK